ncbi:acyl-CoA/acyl-ACP dehydrogenase [Gammaproteobacteria bacterium]|nr:acyl-CoA/acyl-ACP dehydrogenase [Gammaproteobacteria bacterium]
MSDLDKQFDNVNTLLNQCTEKLSGDLFEEQIEIYDLAFSRAELLAARVIREKAKHNSYLENISNYFCSRVIHSINGRLSQNLESYGIDSNSLLNETALQPYLNSQSVRQLGRQFIEEGLPIEDFDQEKALMRDTFSNFTDEIVKPLAEQIHRKNMLIPLEIIDPLRKMGVFGLSVPLSFGGLTPNDGDDSLGMVIATEELSRGSLGAAGSLITRPEIVARAILEGGTESQKARWLPGIAKGDPLCAVSVTEPNTGSDVAAVSLKASKVDGGWVLNGGKTWCTFAGAAGLILVLARTEEEHLGHRGLSLFIVEKDSHEGESFLLNQSAGGKLSGEAIPTIGYRGMHSFEMFFDDYFVPEDCLIGGEVGRGQGFYYTMKGFSGGRLQTAARACGLMRAAFEEAVRYTSDRKVFGRTVAEYPLSLAKIANMGAFIVVCKELTYEVAKMMNIGKGQTEASLVKLLSCRAAEGVTRDALQLFGGMGYAEESAVSRFFVDARVLSIFEGAEETLAIRVLGKSLLRDQ